MPPLTPRTMRFNGAAARVADAAAASSMWSIRCEVRRSLLFRSSPKAAPPKRTPMSLHRWPAHERPRERLLSRGAAALSDAELLAILLRTGIAGSSAVDLARDSLRACD